jgi:hypothetical protein
MPLDGILVRLLLEEFATHTFVPSKVSPNGSRPVVMYMQLVVPNEAHVIGFVVLPFTAATLIRATAPIEGLLFPETPDVRTVAQYVGESQPRVRTRVEYAGHCGDQLAVARIEFLKFAYSVVACHPDVFAVEREGAWFAAAADLKVTAEFA